MGDSFEIDPYGLEDLGHRMIESSVRMGPEMEVALLKIGEEISHVAKGIAGGEGSSSIPPSIHVVPLGRGTIAIRAGEGVPIARLWELGNKGASRTKTTFRHPVFYTPGKKKVYVEQERHPYLLPARVVTSTFRRREVRMALDRTMEPYRVEWD